MLNEEKAWLEKHPSAIEQERTETKTCGRSGCHAPRVMPAPDASPRHAIVRQMTLTAPVERPLAERPEDPMRHPAALRTPERCWPRPTHEGQRAEFDDGEAEQEPAGHG
jgi:hypothetical protein